MLSRHEGGPHRLFELKLEGNQRKREMEARGDFDFSYWGRKKE